MKYELTQEQIKLMISELSKVCPNDFINMSDFKDTCTSLKITCQECWEKAFENLKVEE